MKQAIRSLALRVNKDLALRTEEYQGREHLVIPVIALVETVVFAGNADAPEFVPASEVTDEKFVSGFNGRPIFSGHPQNDAGQYLMGNQPSVLEEKQIGTVFNAKAADGKLKLEAWIDVERTKEIEPELLARIEENDGIEVSVGVFVDTEMKKGEHEGKRYAGVWHNIVPDHLAILPLGQIGACSIEQGCGVRAAHSKGLAMKTKNLSAGMKQRTLASFLRSLVTVEEMSDNDVRMKLYQALREKVGPRACGFVEAVYDNLVVYTTFDDAYEMEMYSRDYALDASGVVSLGETVKKVEPRIVYDEVPEGEAARAAHSCSCQKTRTADTGETLMKNLSDALKAKLEAATPEQVAAVEALFAAPVVAEAAPEAAPVAEAAPVVEETPAPVVETPAVVEETPAPVVAEAKIPTLEELLALAPAEVKAAYESNVRAAAEAKTAAVKVLRASGRCDLTDQELNAKPQSELDALVKLASANLTAGSVDFSGQGVTPAARNAETAKTVPAPPDMAAAIRAANGVQ